MTGLPRWITPGGTYQALRDQLGSVRGVYLAGDRVKRRGDMGEHQELVLLIHGFFQTRNVWEIMEDRLRFDGYGVMSFNLGGLFYRFNTNPVDRSAARIAEKVEALAERYGFDRFHVVGHSKGGLIARRYVQAWGGHRRVKSVITLGTPHHGTPTAALAVALTGFGKLAASAREMLPRSELIHQVGRDRFPADIPLVSIYSRDDLVVPWRCSMLRPSPDEEATMHNVEVRGVGHSQLLWDTGVYRRVRDLLDEASAAASPQPVELPASAVGPR